MDAKTKESLKKGFTLCRWGIDLFWTALIFVFVWIGLVLGFKKTGLMNIVFIALGTVIAGLLLFFAGRVTVGLTSRKLNFEMDRPLTDEEAAFVRAMISAEDTAAKANLESRAAGITSNKIDDVYVAGKNSGIINSFMNEGKKYMGTNFLVNRICLIAGIVAAAVLFAVSL